jgi:hypothetical protein
MEISITSDNKYDVINHIIRDVHIYLEDEKHLSLVPHLQVQLAVSNNKAESQIHYVLTYFDKEGSFLGFDESAMFSAPNQKDVSVSFPLSIPDTADRASLEVKDLSARPTQTSNVHSYLAIIVILGAFALFTFA